MCKNRILLVVVMVLGVIISASDASTRILMANEKPSSEKVSPSPAPNSPPANKESNPNQLPKPVGSLPDSNKPSDQPNPKIEDATKKDEDVTNKDEDKKETKDPQHGNKEDEENKGKNDDKKKEHNDPPKSEDKNGKSDDKQKAGNGPSKSQETVKKDDETKEGNGPSKSQETAKKDDETKEGNGPSKSPESMKKDDEKPENKRPNGGESHVNKSQLEKCEGSLQRCQMQDLSACLQHSEIADSKDLVIIVQNAGDNTLNVNIAVPTSVRIDAKMLNLAKHNTKKVNISADDTKILRIVLNAGKGDCALQIGMGLSISDWIQQFPAYAKQLTPMYGAYFLFVTVVIAGVIWACCKFRNRGRRADDGITYQQLEMGAQRQSGTEIVEAGTVDGWEQGWDDDWDEEEATVRPSTTSHNGNVSSNGLSSRSPSKKNDWDIEWDD